ncbi:MAG: Gfo/Idh/MocA family oxidoreductase [Candidatus Hydrogenedentes bacterium]|nr:Gfo/Idh/MocA family oxidoreductase [Candidatus Hydrogenedentota bacterium]
MVKVAFVGCGGVQKLHATNLTRNPDVTIVGHCDVDRDRAEESASRFGGEAFTDFTALFDKTKPHAAFITVPPYAHGAMEEAAAERGIHLFIEKPVALTKETAQRIAAAVRRAKIICSVGYCFRYYETAIAARKELKGRPIALATGYWRGGMPAAPWWRQMDKSGGQVHEQSTHIFDLLRYLCGEIGEVHAIGSTGCMSKVEGYDIQDSSVVSLRFKNGATGAVFSSCVNGNGTDAGLEVVCPDIELALKDGSLTLREDGKTTRIDSKTDPFEEEARVFIEAVKTQKRNKIRSTYNDAMKSLLVTLAANESMRSGMPVKP